MKFPCIFHIMAVSNTYSSGGVVVEMMLVVPLTVVVVVVVVEVVVVVVSKHCLLFLFITFLNVGSSSIIIK